MILAHIKGILPANLYYCTPNPDIPALLDGKIQVVDKNVKFSAKYVGLNSTGFGGTNVHIVLKFDNHQDIENSWKPKIPLIILCSGRTAEAVQHFLENALIESHDQHFVKLLHELSKNAIPRHPYRGYAVINSDNIDIHVDKNELKDYTWFIFTGMGSQWPGMSNDLVRFEAFNKSVSVSQEYLNNVGFNLMNVLQSSEPTVFDDLKNAIVALSAFQVALVALLKSV
ncbi:unnamed protein product, partial [Allacma fusca]